MARIRTIKPEFFTHEELSTLPAETHLLAAGLLCQADDEGYFQANPLVLAGAVFPIRKCPISVQEMLSQLANIGYITLGVRPDGKQFGRVAKFLVHQRINRPSQSKIKNFNIAWKASLCTHEAISEGSLLEGNRELGTGKRNGNGNMGTGNRGTGDWEEEGECGEGETRPADEAQEQAVRLFEMLKISPDAELMRFASTAIHERARRAGGSEQAGIEILNSAIKARANGIVIGGRWFEQEFPVVQ